MICRPAEKASVRSTVRLISAYVPAKQIVGAIDGSFDFGIRSGGSKPPPYGEERTFLLLTVRLILSGVTVKILSVFHLFDLWNNDRNGRKDGRYFYTVGRGLAPAEKVFNRSRLFLKDDLQTGRKGVSAINGSFDFGIRSGETNRRCEDGTFDFGDRGGGSKPPPYGEK